MSTLIHQAVVVPRADTDSVVLNGSIAFDDRGVITGLGPSQEFNPSHYATVIDGQRSLVIPGLINPHSHCLSNLQKGRLEKLPLEIWRQYLKACWRRVSDRHVYLASMLGSIQMVKTGCTTVLDHFFTASTSEFMGARQVLDAWRDLGIRGVLAPMLSDVRYEETVPLDTAIANGSALAEIERISIFEGRESTADAVRMIERYRGESDRVTFFLGPAAPQRCSPELLRAAVRAADDLDIGLHMHVAETRTQAFVARRSFGSTLIERLDSVGFLNHRLTIAHGIWIEPSDIALIRSTGTSVVHNPVANLKLGDGLAPIIPMLEAGVNVAVATDGAASNDGQNMFEAMKLAAILHCINEDDFERWVSAEQALNMGTLAAARACRLDGITGSLEVGKQADLVLLDRSSFAFVPLNDPIKQLVYCENGSAVSSSFVGGRPIMENGQLAGVNEIAIYDEIQVEADKVADDFRREFTNVAELVPVLKEMYFRIMGIEPRRGVVE